MADWKNPAFEIPPDGTTVWVRPVYWWSAPFLATINYGNVNFVSVNSSVPYPVWSIARWRYQ